MDASQDSRALHSAQMQQASTSETSEKMFEKKYTDTEDAYAHAGNAV
jgi:hypothetical protein